MNFLIIVQQVNESNRKTFLGDYYVLTPFLCALRVSQNVLNKKYTFRNQICTDIIWMHVALYMHEPMDA